MHIFQPPTTARLATAVLLALLATAVPAVPQEETPEAANVPREITLELIMSHPDWIGNAPTSPYWADDSRSIYYLQKRPGEEESDLVRALRESTQDSANQVGERLTERNLNIQQTVTIRPGWPLRVIVHKELVLRSYRG